MSGFHGDGPDQASLLASTTCRRACTVHSDPDISVYPCLAYKEYYAYTQNIPIYPITFKLQISMFFLVDVQHSLSSRSQPI